MCHIAPDLRSTTHTERLAAPEPLAFQRIPSGVRSALLPKMSIPRLWLALLSVGVLWGQSGTTGALGGTVKDKDGTPIPEVTVSLVNRATNQTFTAKTAANGTYHFSLLSPGEYEVRFAAVGYGTELMSSMVINVAEDPALNASLEPGEIQVPRSCHCIVGPTAASSNGTLVDGKTIRAVPLNTRNLAQMLSMASGSAADVNNAGTLGRGTPNVNVNGNTTAGAYSIDGAYSPTVTPNPDAISQLRIQTSQYDAGYGAQVPGTSLITKSGENGVHGDAWEFVRNDVFNANAFFRNSAGQARPNLKQNQYGATLGGPVRHNKLFYFGSWQGTRQTNGLDPTSTSNLILPPLNDDRSAASLAAQFCPANHMLNGQPNPQFLTFAGGKQLDCDNRNTATTAPINPVALRLLQTKLPDGSWLIPNPQTLLTGGSDAGLGFSSYALPSTYHDNPYMLNLDYLLAPKQTLSVRSYFATVTQLRTFGAPGSYPGVAMVPEDGSPQSLSAEDYVNSIRLTSNLSRGVVNEARISFTRTIQNAHGVGTPTASSLGMTAADPTLAQAPEIDVLGPLGTFRLFGSLLNDFGTHINTWSGADTVSLVRGRHSLRLGAVLWTQFNARLDTGTSRGKMVFQTFEDFLVGLNAAANLSPSGRSNVESIQANEGVGPNGEAQYQFRTWNASAFAQDDFKITPNLTMNLGLRWEYLIPAADTAGENGNVWLSLLQTAAIPSLSGTLVGNTVPANYNPNLINSYTGQPFGAVPNGVLVRPNDTYYTNSAPKLNMAPRVSVAWQPPVAGNKLTVRAGYGLFYLSPAFSGNAAGSPLLTDAPFSQGFTNSDASNNLSSFAQPFPVTTLGYVLRTPTSQLSDRIAGQTFRVPRLQQFNLGTQTRLTKTLTLDAGYVGSRGSDLLIAVGQNQPLLASVSHPVNCGWDGVPTDCITTNTSANAGLRVPIMGETPTALVENEYAGSSWYDSLQATLRLQATRGLSFQAAYTYSKATSNATIYNDLNNLALDRARTAFDRTNRLIATFDYELPGGLWRTGALATLTRGWSLSGIVIVQSGLPMTLADPNGGTVYGKASASTITMCPGATYADLSTKGTVESRLNQWINPGAICAPTGVGMDGSTTYGNAGQSIVNGPGQINTDFSLNKTARVGGIHESAVLGFRLEFYNALNHAQFSNPGTTLDTATFGVITQTSVAPRLIQAAMKYVF